MIIVTTDSVPGRAVAGVLGLVEGSSAVSPGFEKGISAVFSALSAGSVRELEETLEKARAVAREKLVERARALGADAVTAFRYAEAGVGQGICDVIAYGTAVKLK